MKVILKKEKVSAKFGIVFLPNTPMVYSKELKSIEHPVHKNIWIRVEPSEFKPYVCEFEGKDCTNCKNNC